MPSLRRRPQAQRPGSSWSPQDSPDEVVYLQRREDGGEVKAQPARIDDDPFAYFLTPPSSPSVDDDAESVGTSSDSGRPPSPSSHQTPTPAPKATHSLPDLRRWVLQLPQPLAVPHTPHLAPQRDLMHSDGDIPPLIPSLKRPGRGRQPFRSPSARADRRPDRLRRRGAYRPRPRSWREPEAGLWRVEEEEEEEEEEMDLDLDELDIHAGDDGRGNGNGNGGGNGQDGEDEIARYERSSRT
ncbi:MAG: hypothetical protein M1832_002662 [Thelocarpon impressellum]|nr:MAG: hypothetical protein M1832_002662 [Thelocarpon impressellum]